jgi:peptide/nickel transport system permease protein
VSSVDGTPVLAGAGGRRRTRLRLPGRERLGVVGVISAAIIAIAAALALIGPAIAPHDPNAGLLSDAFVGPGPGHPLGFDGQGRDLLSRLLAGARSSLLGPLAVVAMSMLVGTLLAVFSAWRGGWFDGVTSAVMDILFAFPAILLAILAAAVFGSGLVAASIALAIAYTPYIARVIRSGAQRERAQGYVAALEVQGLPALAICVRHLVPNVLPLIVAQGTVLFGYAMVDLAAISFIGLGVQPPQADWGLMVASGQSGVIQGYPAESLSAGLCIVIVVVAFHLLGEKLSGGAERGSLVGAAAEEA